MFNVWNNKGDNKEMPRPAQYEHQCQKCGQIIRAYRDCSGEKHMPCATRLPNGALMGGELKLIKKYSYAEAKAKELMPIWV